MSRPQNSFVTIPQPQKVKNDPKIKSKSRVRIEGSVEKKVIQAHEWIPGSTEN